MRGTLYFSDSAGWTEPLAVGTLRDEKRGYNIKPMTELNREANPEPVGYEVEVNSLILELNASFLTQGSWYFRVYFLDEGRAINLGLRQYLIDYDGQIVRNGIEYHEVKLKFNIAADEYSAYAIPVSVPNP